MQSAGCIVYCKVLWDAAAHIISSLLGNNIHSIHYCENCCALVLLNLSCDWTLTCNKTTLWCWDKQPIRGPTGCQPLCRGENTCWYWQELEQFTFFGSLAMNSLISNLNKVSPRSLKIMKIFLLLHIPRLNVIFTLAMDKVNTLFNISFSVEWLNSNITKILAWPTCADRSVRQPQPQCHCSCWLQALLFRGQTEDFGPPGPTAEPSTARDQRHHLKVPADYQASSVRVWVPNNS